MSKKKYACNNASVDAVFFLYKDSARCLVRAFYLRVSFQLVVTFCISVSDQEVVIVVVDAK